MCHARNLGIDHCGGEIIAFTDDDCIVDRDWVKELVKVYEKEDAAVVGGISYRGNTRDILRYPRFNGRVNYTTTPASAVSGVT